MLSISCLRSPIKSRSNSSEECGNTPSPERVLFSPLDQSCDDLKSSLKEAKRISDYINNIVIWRDPELFSCFSSPKGRDERKHFQDLGRKNLPLISENQFNIRNGKAQLNRVYKVLVLDYAISRAHSILDESNSTPKNIFQKWAAFCKQGLFSLSNEDEIQEVTASHSTAVRELNAVCDATLDALGIKETVQKFSSLKSSPTSPLACLNKIREINLKQLYQEQLKRRIEQASLLQTKTIKQSGFSPVSSRITRVVMIFGQYGAARKSDQTLSWDDFVSNRLEKNRHSEKILEMAASMARLSHLRKEGKKIMANPSFTVAEISTIIKQIELEGFVFRGYLKTISRA